MKIFIVCIALGLSIVFQASACEILINADKESYAIGDTATVKVIVKLNHKNCADKEGPKLKLTGLELLAKTAWKEKAPAEWVISYKVKILSLENEFFAYRDSCDLGGGKGKIVFQVKK